MPASELAVKPCPPEPALRSTVASDTLPSRHGDLAYGQAAEVAERVGRGPVARRAAVRRSTASWTSDTSTSWASK